jgi:hypothetical protein
MNVMVAYVIPIAELRLLAVVRVSGGVQGTIAPSVVTMGAWIRLSARQQGRRRVWDSDGQIDQLLDITGTKRSFTAHGCWLDVLYEQGRAYILVDYVDMFI